MGSARVFVPVVKDANEIGSVEGESRFDCQSPGRGWFFIEALERIEKFLIDFADGLPCGFVGESC